jgi:hypothetical protein
MLSPFKVSGTMSTTNVALTAQNVSKSESSTLQKPGITAETGDDTSIRTPEPLLTVAFVIEIK